MRLFVAVTFPRPLRERIWKAAEPLRAPGVPIRWVGPDELHLTLRFIGEVPDGTADVLDRAVARVASQRPPFTVRLDGVGAFPSLRRPRVVWLGVEPSEALRSAQHAVEEALVGAGLEPARRGYHPHVTLGRVARPAGRRGWEAFETAAARIRVDAEQAVRSLELVRSRLTPEGARYTTFGSHGLGGASGS
ncbi:MAG: RNA 2',3'-cyclic phosphodiesterase [Gemmatimonadota bacterium]